MKLFKRKRYKIEFAKSCLYKNSETFYTVKDSSIIALLRKLQTKFDFKIISIDLNETKSQIIIHCNKSDKYEIFMEFVTILSGYIEDVKIR